jgi:hypothetical protein
MTLQSIRRITDGIGDVVDNFREVSGSVRHIGKNIEQATYAVRHAAFSSISQTRGIKAGIRTGVRYFVMNALPKHGVYKKQEALYETTG